MTRAQLKIQHEDTLFALFMIDGRGAIEKEAQRERERLKQSTDALVPKEIRKHCLQAISQYFRQVHRQRVGHFVRKILGRLLIAICALALIFVAVLYYSEPIRVDFFNFLIDIQEGSTDTNISSDFVRIDNNEGWPSFTVGWMPEGYLFSGGYESAVRYLESYLKSTDEIITITYARADEYTLNVDAKGATIEGVTIQGLSGTLFTKETEQGEELTLVYMTGDATDIIHITAVNMNQDDFLRVASELEFES